MVRRSRWLVASGPTSFAIARSALRQQRSIARAVSVDGFGYWSGQDVRVTFRPAPPDSGLVFVRRDLSPPVSIPVDVRHQIDIPRRTNLCNGGVSVEMVEHVLAACAGLAIDNCQIDVSAPELPGCDGSSGPFVRALLRAGIVLQAAPRRRLVVDRVLRVGTEACWVEARPPERLGLSVLYCLDYGPDSYLGRQQYELALTPERFVHELADARTFLMEQEAEWLLQQGVGQRVSYQDLLIFGEDGPRGNALRFPDECVRHKALDLIGDLSLAGCDIVGRIVAFRSGHRLNAELVRRLLDTVGLAPVSRKSA